MELNLKALVQAPAEGEYRWFDTGLVNIRATAATTGGAFGMANFTMPPGFETPFHRHLTEDESFYVIDGEVAFLADGQWARAGAGSFVFIPRGMTHGFRVVGNKTARMLVWVNPGGFEEFFIAMSEPATTATLPDKSTFSIERALEVAPLHGMDILGPLAAEGSGDSAAE